MMSISGKIILFVNENTKTKNTYFTTTIGSKNQDGTYENYQMVVRFVGELKEKATKLSKEYRYTVDVIDGFLSHFNQKVELVVKDAKIESKEKLAVKKPEKKEKPKKEFTDDEMPF